MVSHDCIVVKDVDNDDESGWADTEPVGEITDEGNGDTSGTLLVDRVEVDAEGLGNVTVPTEVVPAVLGVLEATTGSAVLLPALLKAVDAGIVDGGEDWLVVELAGRVITLEDVAGLLEVAGADDTSVTAVEVSIKEAELDTEVDEA